MTDRRRPPHRPDDEPTTALPRPPAGAAPGSSAPPAAAPAPPGPSAVPAADVAAAQPTGQAAAEALDEEPTTLLPVADPPAGERTVRLHPPIADRPTVPIDVPPPADADTAPPSAAPPAAPPSAAPPPAAPPPAAAPTTQVPVVPPGGDSVATPDAGGGREPGLAASPADADSLNPADADGSPEATTAAIFPAATGPAAGVDRPPGVAAPPTTGDAASAVPAAPAAAPVGVPITAPTARPAAASRVDPADEPAAPLGEHGTPAGPVPHGGSPAEAPGDHSVLVGERTVVLHPGELGIGARPVAAESGDPRSEEPAGRGGGDGPVPRAPEGEADAAADATGAPAAGRPAGLSSGSVLIALLLALFGFMFAVQLRSSGTDEGLAAARQEDLVRILSDLNAREQRLNEDIADLEATRSRLASGVAGRQEALAEAERRADELGLLAGTVAARGSGLVITLSGGSGKPIGATSLLNAVQELRGAGGEVMQLAGADGRAVRVVASTAFVDVAGGGVRVGGVDLGGPYTLTVIGEPGTMDTALRIPGGVVASVSGDGGTVNTVKRDVVDVTATRAPTDLRYARPVS